VRWRADLGSVAAPRGGEPGGVLGEALAGGGELLACGGELLLVPIVAIVGLGRTGGEQLAQGVAACAQHSSSLAAAAMPSGGRVAVLSVARLIVLRDDGSRGPFDDPGATGNDPYVTIRGQLRPSQWGQIKAASDQRRCRTQCVGSRCGQPHKVSALSPGRRELGARRCAARDLDALSR
jgi:hypothetical protein